VKIKKSEKYYTLGCSVRKFSMLENIAYLFSNYDFFFKFGFAIDRVVQVEVNCESEESGWVDRKRRTFWG